MNIYVIDRVSGKKEKEEVYGERAILLLYGSSLFAQTIGRILRWFAALPPFSYLYGWLQTLPWSRRKIVPFIEKFAIESREFADPIEHYTCFNDFFVRKLKPAARPIAHGQERAIIPADGRYRFFPVIGSSQEFLVKGARFCLTALLQSHTLAQQYEGGSLIMARLCPTDCHRFYFPIDCTPSIPQLINGKLFSVNPIATQRNPWIWTENKRVLTLLQSDLFGTVAFIEVGATNVGTIIQTFPQNTPCKKGHEKGYFSFGGSAILMLFEKGALLFDQDLTTQNELEVRCLIGQSLGTCT